MKYVHNVKQRMPVMLKKNDEKAWLDNSNLIKDFAYPYQANLIALPAY
jgi:putative SOS response-associated peptidase YedK